MQKKFAIVMLVVFSAVGIAACSSSKKACTPARKAYYHKGFLSF
jgi:predicted component of type VI protein secretion system